MKVDFEAGRATIGTQRGAAVPEAKILEALESIKYRGEFLTNEQPR